MSRADGDPDALLLFRQVGKTFITRVDVLVEVTTFSQTTRSGGSILTTVGHPFWVSSTHGENAPLADPALPHYGRSVTYRTDAQGNRVCGNSGWVFAKDLEPSYTLGTTTGPGSEVARVRQIECRTTNVYNFRVDGTHTYFVSPEGTVDAPVWAHNTCVKNPGRSGKQERLREIGEDPNQPSHIRGWIQQEQNAMAQGKRKAIRVPPGHQLAHRRGYEARKGYGYEHADLQSQDIHKIQHQYEGYR